MNRAANSARGDPYISCGVPAWSIWPSRNNTTYLVTHHQGFAGSELGEIAVQHIARYLSYERVAHVEHMRPFRAPAVEHIAGSSRECRDHPGAAVLAL